MRYYQKTNTFQVLSISGCCYNIKKCDIYVCISYVINTERLNSAKNLVSAFNKSSTMVALLL